jgi:hypothetical protein
MRKYFPALSNEDSLLSFHLSGFGNRKPGGGGPEGVAYARRVLVEKAGKGLEEAARGRTALESLVAGRLRTTNIVKGFADAIVWLLVARWLKKWTQSLETGAWMSNMD